MRTLLCLASFFKGPEFLEAAKARGHRVLLVTAERLAKEPWPEHAIDQKFLVRAEGDYWNMEEVIKGINHVARRERIDRIVALDDFDVEKAAHLREHLRVDGMGQSQARFFRDKLAMRQRAAVAGLNVPDFCGTFNDADLNHFVAHVPAPWVLKPRSEASAIGIRKIHDADALWAAVEQTEEQRPYYLLERYVPGHVYHVDSLTVGGQVRFARSHRYLSPPLNVMHEGGIFRTVSLAEEDPDAHTLADFNARLLSHFGFVQGVSHTEFIRSHTDGQFYFLETSARVGGAHIADLVEQTTGINLWREWAVLETGGADSYQLPVPQPGFGGLIISLARQEWPNVEAYRDPEIVWRMKKRHHVGLIVRSEHPDRVETLLDEYAERFMHDFHATQPVPDRPTS